MIVRRLARCVAFVIALTLPARAQLNLEWSATYSTPNGDVALVAKVDSSGNVYAAGLSNADGALLDGTAFVAAWDPTGAPLWTATFDSTLGYAEYPDAIEFDGAGGLYVAGVARGAAASEYAGFLLHIDAAGVLTWSVEQPTTTNGEWHASLAVDSQGRAIVGGRVPSGSGDLAVTAYTPAGAVAWQATHAGTAGGADTADDVEIAPNGEIVAVGTLDPGLTAKPVLLRLAADGTVLQALEIVAVPELVIGTAVDVEVDAHGRIFVAANGVSFGSPVPALALFAFDPQGAFLWVRTITGAPQLLGGGASAVDLELDGFGRAVVAGRRAQGPAGTALLAAAYDVNGNEAWRRVENDVKGGESLQLSNAATAIVVDRSGEAVAIGSYAPAIADGTSDAFAFSIDPKGEKRYGFLYGFPATAQGSLDLGIGAAAGESHSLVIVGRAQTSAGSIGFDAFIARFTRTANGYCFGDGSFTSCPCGNASAPTERAGCASSLGIGGRLADLGASVLSADTLVLVGSSMPNSMTVYMQGTLADPGTPFGDGLSCVRGDMIRLGEAFNSAGASQYPSPGSPSISVQGQIAAPGMRVYQAVYRNAAAFCTSDTFNATNGLQVKWGL